MSNMDFRKRQKGALVETSQPKPMRIAAPGMLAGRGPGQGRTEDQTLDDVQQYHLDMRNAPPQLRVERSPPPSGSGDRGRGTVRGARGATARGTRGAARGRGGGRGGHVVGVLPERGPPIAPRGSIPGRGVSTPSRGNAAGPSRAAAPASRLPVAQGTSNSSTRPLPNGSTARNSNAIPGTPAKLPAKVNPNIIPVPSSHRRTFPDPSSSPEQALAGPSGTSGRDLPPTTENAEPAPAVARPYQSMGVYARVMQRRLNRNAEVPPAGPPSTASSHSHKNNHIVPSSQAGGSGNQATKSAPPSAIAAPALTAAPAHVPASTPAAASASKSVPKSAAVPTQPRKFTPNLSAAKSTKNKPSTERSASSLPPTASDTRPGPNRAAQCPEPSGPMVIVRGNNAYSPSEPTLPLPEDGSQAQPSFAQAGTSSVQIDFVSSSDEEPLQQRSRSIASTSRRSEQAEPDVHTSRNTRPIIDYTSQIKSEPGSSLRDTDTMRDESEEEEEEETVEELARQRENDDDKQSGTLLLLKASRPEMSDCWSADNTIKKYARRKAHKEVRAELLVKAREITGCMWRDDGYAVDWVLYRELQSTSFTYPDVLRASNRPKEAEAAVKLRRTKWGERQLDLWKELNPTCERRSVRVTPLELTVYWQRKPEQTNEADDIEMEPLEPTSLLGKRARSVSPASARKKGKQQVGGADGIIAVTNDALHNNNHHYDEEAALERFGVKMQFVRSQPRQELDMTHQAGSEDHLNAARKDMIAWAKTCMPRKIKQDDWHLDYHKPTKHMIKIARGFVLRLPAYWKQCREGGEALPCHENATIAGCRWGGDGSVPEDFAIPGPEFHHNRRPCNHMIHNLAGLKAEEIALEILASDDALRYIILVSFMSECSFKPSNRTRSQWSSRRTFVLLYDKDRPLEDIHCKFRILAEYSTFRQSPPLTNAAEGATGTPTTEPPRMTRGLVRVLDEGGANYRHEELEIESTHSAESTPSERSLSPVRHRQSASRKIIQSEDESDESEGSVRLRRSTKRLVDSESEPEADSVEVEEIETRLEKAVQSQATWQSIKDRAQNKQGPSAKLQQIEDEIVALHLQLIELKEKQGRTKTGSTRQLQDITARDPTEASSSTAIQVDDTPGVDLIAIRSTPNRAHAEPTDLKLRNGSARKVHRPSGDRVRFMLREGASAISRRNPDIATFSMRGAVQYFSGMDKNTATTNLDSGLKIVDGCMPVRGKVIMAVERGPTAPKTDQEHVLCLDASAEPRATYGFIRPKHRTTNPGALYCVGAIGPDTSDIGRYMFASGGLDHKVSLWTVGSQDDPLLAKTVVLHKAHTSFIRSVAFEQEKGWLLSGSSGSNVLVYDCNSSAQKLLTQRFDVGASIWHIHTNEEAPRTIAVEAEQTRDQVYMFDTRRSKPVKRFGYDINLIESKTTGLSRFEKGSFSGSYFARGYADGTIRMWDMRMLQKNEQPYMVAKASAEAIRHVMIDNRKLRVLTGTTLTTYDLDSGN